MLQQRRSEESTPRLARQQYYNSAVHSQHKKVELLRHLKGVSGVVAGAAMVAPGTYSIIIILLLYCTTVVLCVTGPVCLSLEL